MGNDENEKSKINQSEIKEEHKINQLEININIKQEIIIE